MGTADVVQTITRDVVGRTTQIQYGTPTAPSNLGVYSTQYVSASNRLLSQTTPEGTTTYDYTNGGQLKLSGTTSYAYDANGNPTSRAGKTVAIGSFNRILDDGNYVYTYDAEGRTTSRRDKQSGVVDRYEWNHASQLTRVASFANASATTATQSVRYGYDAIGRRSSQSRQAGGSTATAVVDYLLSDGDHLAQMVGGDGSIRSRFLHGPEVDMVLAEQTYSSGTAGQPLWQLTDHLGTVRGIAQSQSNGTVSVVNRLRYDAFGKLLSQSDATKQPRFGFAGRDMEPAGGLNYNRHRYYSPDQSRFISQDPIGFAGGDANLYRYVGNHPTMATDPTGLWEWSDNWFTSFTYVAGQAGAGFAQGAANTVNSITNTAASAGNLVISIPNTVANGIDYLAGTPEHQQIRIPNIPTSEWSRGLFTEETDFEHGLSSIAAGTGVQILTGVGAAKLASVPSYASLGSSLLAIDVLENGSNIASGAIDVYQSGSLNSNNGTQILLGSVGVAANFASKIKTKKGATTPAENGVDAPVRTFPNQMAGSLAEEIAAAARAGAKPIPFGAKGTNTIVNSGTIKYVVTESGELIISPHTVNGIEISHAVLSGGRPVLAAGQADIAAAGGKMLGIDISRHSGHFIPTEESLAVARAAFEKCGVVFPNK